MRRRAEAHAAAAAELEERARQLGDRDGAQHEGDVVPLPVAPVLAPAAYTGTVGAIVRAIEPHTEAQPAGILVSLLVAVGAQLGRGPHQLIDGTRHGTNLYALLVGPSMDGRSRRLDE